MISHDNVTWTAANICRLLSITAEDEIISYLPLSHIAAQLVDMHGPMACGAQVYFAQPDALRGSLPVTLLEVRPTIFLGVPRVVRTQEIRVLIFQWEKFVEKMQARFQLTSGMKKKILDWARGKGVSGNVAVQKGQSKPRGFGTARRMVFNDIRVALGLDRCRYCVFFARSCLTLR
jgi:long-chain-fatty-acid--CoA ligase ACSBG